jgi:hypothetical protein
MNLSLNVSSGQDWEALGSLSKNKVSFLKKVGVRFLLLLTPHHLKT